jgi:hypothetical protein
VDDLTAQLATLQPRLTAAETAAADGKAQITKLTAQVCVYMMCLMVPDG